MAQALLGTAQPQVLGRHGLRRPAQAAGQPVDALRLGIEPAAQGAVDAFLQHVDAAQPLLARCTGQLGGGGGRGRAQVGHEVGDGEVGLVSYAADDRHRAGGDGAGQLLVVEGPQILDGAAAAHQQDEVDGWRGFMSQIGLQRLSLLRQQIQIL